jgi:hypothetical protein
MGGLGRLMQDWIGVCGCLWGLFIRQFFNALYILDVVLSLVQVVPLFGNRRGWYYYTGMRQHRRRAQRRKWSGDRRQPTVVCDDCKIDLETAIDLKRRPLYTLTGRLVVNMLLQDSLY